MSSFVHNMWVEDVILLLLAKATILIRTSLALKQPSPFQWPRVATAPRSQSSVSSSSQKRGNKGALVGHGRTVRLNSLNPAAELPASQDLFSDLTSSLCIKIGYQNRSLDVTGTLNASERLEWVLTEVYSVAA